MENHITTLVKKACQHLYHRRSLKDFKLPTKVQKNVYTCTIKNILTGNITAWFGNSTNQDRWALQRGVLSAERIIRIELPDLESIYNKRCCTKARKIIKDLSHPSNGLFSLLRSEKRFRSLMTKTERMRKGFFAQAIHVLNQDNANKIELHCTTLTVFFFIITDCICIIALYCTYTYCQTVAAIISVLRDVLILFFFIYSLPFYLFQLFKFCCNFNNLCIFLFIYIFYCCNFLVYILLIVICKSTYYLN